MGKLNRVTQGIIKTRGQFSAFGVNAKNINKELAPDDIDAAMAIIDLKNWNNSENGQLSVSFDENGVPLFTVKNYHYSGAKIDPKTGEILSPESRWGDAVTMNMDQLLEMFPVQNFDFDAEMLSDLTDTQKKGKLNGKGGTYDFKTKQNRSSFIGKFEGDDGRKLFHDIANRRLKNLGMPSLKEALLDDISVPISILDNMFVDDGDDRINIGQVFKELDIDGSGFVDQADITLASKLPENAFVEFESNIEIMLDSLTNVNNEAFDMSRSLELLADYYIGSEAISGVGGEVIRPAIKGVSQQYYDEAYNLGVKTQEEINYNDNKNPKNPQYVKINDNRGSVKFELAIEKVRQIKDGTSAVKDWDDNIWVPDGKGNWTNKDYVDPNTKKPKPITSDQLVRLESFSLDNYLDVYDPNAFPRKKLLLNLGSQFSDMQGNNREAQYYINKPIEFSQVLNRDFNTKDFSHEGNNLVVDIGNNQEAVFDLSQKSELEALLKYLNRNKNIYTTRV